MTDLSGRVTDLEKLYLTVATQDDLSTLTSFNASRFNSLQDTLTILVNEMQALHQKVVNLELASRSGSLEHHHVFSEVPSGAIDGSNRVFTLTGVPNPASSLMLVRNGLTLYSGSGNDFEISSSTITFVTGNAPQSGSNLFASYIY